MVNEEYKNLLSADELRESLVSLLPGVKDYAIIISAFVTQPAVDLLFEYLSEAASVSIVCRLHPHDVRSGATDLSALRIAIQRGAKVSFIQNLHAKAYLFDDDILFSGSANFTGSGLNIHGRGNIELNKRVEVNSQTLKVIRDVRKDAMPLTLEMLNAMEQHIGDQEDVDTHDDWPPEIVPENDDLWTADCFWSVPHGPISDENIQHDLEILKIQDFEQPFEAMQEAVRKTPGIRWLRKTLMESEAHESYFGRLTAALHTDLLDDPSPYRSSVKILLQNLTIYCETYLSDEIEVTRPRYSQRFRLLTSH